MITRIITRYTAGSLLLVALFSWPAIAVAGSAMLSWVPPTTNTDGTPLTDLAGYKIHYGSSPGNYGAPMTVGNVTTYTVTGLGVGTYYFAVTAYDTSGNESGFSNQASKTIVGVPPVISGIAAQNITATGATIIWTTDVASTSQIEYGTTVSYGTSTTLNSSLVTSHSQPLSGLLASTLYHYRVWSVDAASNVAVSADNTFTTLAAPDTTPPVISGVTASNITTSGAVITWTTNEASNTQVDYGTTTGYGSSTTLNSALVTSHSQTLSGLLANTLYHYRVKSRDSAGNLATSGDFTFTTSTIPDTTGPVISNVAASNVTSVGTTITWTTNEAATSQVDYGTTIAYGSSTALSTTLVTSHSRALSGLQPSTLYHYRVRSADGANNLTLSGDQTVTTSAAADTTPPGDVQQFTAVGGDQQVTLSWTNPPDGDFVGARILFRTDRFPVGLQDGTLLGDFTGQPNGTMSTAHAGLQNGVTYYYSASSYDLGGNYQTTAFASATPTIERVEDPSSSAAMGCGGGAGAIAPQNGDRPGTGQSQLNLVPSVLVILLVGLLKWFRRTVSFLRRQEFRGATTVSRAWILVFSAVHRAHALVCIGQCRRGDLVLEP